MKGTGWSSRQIIQSIYPVETFPVRIKRLQSRPVLLVRLHRQRALGSLEFSLQRDDFAMPRKHMQPAGFGFVGGSFPPGRGLVSQPRIGLKPTDNGSRCTCLQMGAQSVPVKGRNPGRYVYDFIAQPVKTRDGQIEMGKILQIAVQQGRMVQYHQDQQVFPALDGGLRVPGKGAFPQFHRGRGDKTIEIAAKTLPGAPFPPE